MRVLYSIASALSALALAALVLATSAAVAARYVLGKPIAWTEEVSGLLMIWIVMLGAIACEAKRKHLTIDLIDQMLGPRTRQVLRIAIGLASIALLLVMAWQAWKLGQTTAFKKTQILGISWFWLDLAVVIGAAGTALVTFMHLFRPEEASVTDTN